MKTERNAIVKEEEEEEMDGMPYKQFEVNRDNNIVLTQLNEVRSQKDKIIGELIQIKSENQKLKIELIDRKKQCDDLQKTCKTSAEKIASLTNENVNLKHNLNTLQNQCEGAKKDAKEATENNKVLSAKFSQLQRSINDTNSKDDSNVSKEYEVESILKDKKVKRTRYFLIRWKGFSSEHDSWEKESNLKHCTKILDNYLASKPK